VAISFASAAPLRGARHLVHQPTTFQPERTISVASDGDTPVANDQHIAVGQLFEPASEVACVVGWKDRG
jgi:hypothetical protein